jgi:hypothetical protein
MIVDATDAQKVLDVVAPSTKTANPKEPPVKKS